ncbi:ABC-2 transporter permease [Anaerobacillus alkaliphilus]|uniref:ABC-2 transporter permease n=1 Tax=Anaerobacillus alkaliphilus TaxID=1548597 RepID=A0A4Q0VQX1_9BACI|nr:ABC transporter permease [Anaerobacillus alkaliphilus]RXI97760.1 ABC-2 transporter permease [Anaerobacillus alkaliphilus]
MPFFAIVKKDLKILLGDPGALVVLFLLPIMFISVMSFALMPVYKGNNSNIEIIVVNEDDSLKSKEFLTELAYIEGLDITTTIDNEINFDAHTAQQLVQDGKYPMAIVVPSDFGRNITTNQVFNLVSIKDPAQQTTVEILEKAIEGVVRGFSVKNKVDQMVEQQLESINQTIHSEMQKIEAVYTNEIDQLMASLNSMALSGLPVDVPATAPVTPQFDGIDIDTLKVNLAKEAKETLDNPTIGIHSLTTDGKKTLQPDPFQQSVPAYTVMFAFFIVTFAGRSFLVEKNEGTFQRILSSPITGWSFILGKWIPNYLVGLAQVVVMFSIGHFIFGMSLGNSLLGLLLISFALVWASSSLGMMIASLVKTEAQISGWSVMAILTLAALGGTMVPLFIMPEFMQKLALITPHAWALMGYQDILVRGLHATDVLLHVLVLFCFGLFFIAISIWRFTHHILQT